MRTIANRLNAVKSTGPKTEAGRHRAARNALKHGMTASLPPGQVLEVYRELVGDAVEPASAIEFQSLQTAALKLAAAEVRLDIVKATERRRLEKGNLHAKLVADVNHALDVLHGQVPGNPKPSMREYIRGMLDLRQTVLCRQLILRRRYRLMLRYREEAESAWHNELVQWIFRSTGENPETKPT